MSMKGLVSAINQKYDYIITNPPIRAGMKPFIKLLKIAFFI